jgi:hypothetical protein
MNVLSKFLDTSKSYCNELYDFSVYTCMNESCNASKHFLKMQCCSKCLNIYCNPNCSFKDIQHLKMCILNTEKELLQV